MLFSEIYGCYYSAVAAVLAQAVQGGLTAAKMEELVREKAFAESVLTIPLALKNGRWPLLCKDFTTPLGHRPSQPMTLLQKRWLKAISLDARIRLFGVEVQGLEDVSPLFTPKDWRVFDCYADGDPYEDEQYIAHFQTVLRALRENRRLTLEYRLRDGQLRRITCRPYRLEYSEKDDKFRLLTAAGCVYPTLNLCRVEDCLLLESANKVPQPHAVCRKRFVMEISAQRNAPERALLHFANAEKRAERTGDGKLRLEVFYAPEDETEMVIRVLSFGPMAHVLEPEAFVEKLRARLRAQLACGLK